MEGNNSGKKKRTVVVICGSDSDFAQISPGLAMLRAAEAQDRAEVLTVEVCSAHRNPADLRDLLQWISCVYVDVVIACAGKLAALFGDSDAISRNEIGNSHTCFVAVPLRGKTEESTQAAYLAAKEVPNSQFVFKEEFFGNPEKAFEYAIDGDLPEIMLK